MGFDPPVRCQYLPVVFQQLYVACKEDIDLKDPNSPLNSSFDERLPPEPPGTRVLWLQVAGLAAVQAAITLTWIIYTLSLRPLLVEVGFPERFADTLLLVESLLGVFLEPLMGNLSDQSRHRFGTKLPFITVGVILTSALFIAIPAAVTFSPTIAVRLVLPGVIILWYLAMTVFRSPVLSLIKRYARPSALPLAASLLTLSNVAVDGFKPFIQKGIIALGSSFSFAIGSFVLLGAVAILRFVHPPETPASSSDPESLPYPSYSLLRNLSLIFIAGAGVTWGRTFLMDALQKVINSNAFNIDWVNAITIALGLAALPAGAIATKFGNQRTMLLSIGVTIGLMILMVLSPNLALSVGTIILLVPALSLIINSAIPFALSLVTPSKAGLAIGTFFAGASLARGQFGIIFPPSSPMTPIEAVSLGAIAFLAASLCIAISMRNSQTTAGSEL